MSLYIVFSDRLLIPLIRITESGSDQSYPQWILMSVKKECLSNAISYGT